MQRRDGARPGRKGAPARTGRKGRRPIGRPTSVDPRRSRAAVADRATEASRGERSPTPSGRSRPGFRNATSVKSEGLGLGSLLKRSHGFFHSVCVNFLSNAHERQSEEVRLCTG